MARDYKLGFQHGIKWAIQWLHEEARRMNDPKAKGVLNSAAFHLGTRKRGIEPIPTEDKTDIAAAINQVASRFEGVQPRVLINREDGIMTLEWEDREAGVGIALLIHEEGEVLAASRFPGHGYPEGFMPLPEPTTSSA